MLVLDGQYIKYVDSEGRLHNKRGCAFLDIKTGEQEWYIHGERMSVQDWYTEVYNDWELILEVDPYGYVN